MGKWHPQTDERAPMSYKSEVGKRLRSLRKADQMTLAELAERADVSVSTISKIENGALSPTLDVILKLCDGLGVKIGDLVTGGETGNARLSTPNSRFSPYFKGDGALISTSNYDYLYLCPEVKNKFIVPIIARVKARDIQSFGELFHHGGEEFLYVLEGQVEVHSEFYEPVILNKGDGVYLDSAMGHGYLSTGDGEAEVLCICTEPQVQSI
ncbi:XRE family transcriptional regulator [Seohaeicola zhoushanensis]|uniref:XRE family transcriptional regulator n=2 Tax=Seohaeicola zhoushanensis TaxID=1569283 RepID=A0A8J3GUS1_9RHOB|nr:XRE family transcriptional regulator [Seohaeicola zhoushanensis]